MFGNTGFIHYGPHGSGPKGASVNPATHKRYTTRALVKAFAEGATSGHAGALRITDGVLYSYREPIAVRTDPPHNRLAYVTSQRFSVTTTKHTRMAAVALTAAGWEVQTRNAL